MEKHKGAEPMKITIIHGQSHKGITYAMVHEVLKYLATESDEIQEFFLPKDGPGFCMGCTACFLKGEDNCPCADKVQPIARALDWADVIMLDSPNYVMEMCGAMKNLMDHFAYRWVSHRPSGTMFKKIGITLSSSAGAPALHVVRSMAKQLKWMCVSKVYLFPFTSFAMRVNDLKPKKKAELEHKAKQIADKVKKRVAHPRASLRSKLSFRIFRKMQSSAAASWNPTDRDWWVKQGWLAKIRPWKG
jgi:multimeric flavodoxin WrbA